MFGPIVHHKTTYVWVWVLSPNLPVYMFENVRLHNTEYPCTPLGCISRDSKRSGAQGLSNDCTLSHLITLTVVVAVVRLIIVDSAPNVITEQAFNVFDSSHGSRKIVALFKPWLFSFECAIFSLIGCCSHQRICCITNCLTMPSPAE